MVSLSFPVRLLQQVDELTHRNEDLEQKLETAEQNASAAAKTVAAGNGTTCAVNQNGDTPEEVARLNQVIDELRAGDAQNILSWLCCSK